MGETWHALGIHGVYQSECWASARVGLGAAFVAYQIIATLDDHPAAQFIELQLLVGIPAWFAIVSPFQEFFFRAWLQPRLQQAAGKKVGLMLASISFAAWHLIPPFEGTPTSSIVLFSVDGIITTIVLGLILGYAFQRAKHIAAPCVAHAMAGIVLVVLGQMGLL